MPFHTVPCRSIPSHTFPYHYIPIHTVTPLRTNTSHYIPSYITHHCMPMLAVTLRCIAMQCVTLRRSIACLTLHCITLHHITIQHITLHYATLHDIGTNKVECSCLANKKQLKTSAHLSHLQHVQGFLCFTGPTQRPDQRTKALEVSLASMGIFDGPEWGIVGIVNSLGCKIDSEFMDLLSKIV